MSELSHQEKFLLAELLYDSLEGRDVLSSEAQEQYLDELTQRQQDQHTPRRSWDEIKAELNAKRM